MLWAIIKDTPKDMEYSSTGFLVMLRGEGYGHLLSTERTGRLLNTPVYAIPFCGGEGGWK